MREKLPYICPNHPKAYIKREWARDIITAHLTGATITRDSKFRYYCNDCGRELAEEDRDIALVKIPGTTTSEVIKEERIRPTDYSKEQSNG